MKKTLTILLALMFIGCGKDGPVGPPGPPGPPGPGPAPIPVPVPTPVPVPVITVFTVDGKKITIKAQMKSDAKVTLEEMRAAIKTTVAQLENARR